MSSPEGSRIVFRRAVADLRPRALENFARKMQVDVAKGRDFDCLITGDAELRKLNREFRAVDEPTDVLSFPSGAGLSGAGLPACAGIARTLPAQAGNPAPLGSIAISAARARAQARAFRHSTEAEVRILMLHGLLHLLGYDHETDNGRMARAEKRWRQSLGLANGLIERVRP